VPLSGTVEGSTVEASPAKTCMSASPRATPRSGEAFLPVSLVHALWAKMRTAVDLPAGPEAGEKLIRRSMATIDRKRVGEANWRQGEMMLGHVNASVSDIYAARSGKSGSRFGSYRIDH
jgi:hypothetical protein